MYKDLYMECTHNTLTELRCQQGADHLAAPLRGESIGARHVHADRTHTTAPQRRARSAAAPRRDRTPRCAVERLAVPLDLVFDRAASQHAVVEDAVHLEKTCIPGVDGPARTKLMLACGSEFTPIFVRSTECALR